MSTDGPLADFLRTIADSRMIRRDSLFIAIAGYREGTEMDATQARRLAAALLDAADEWDLVTS